LGCFLEHNRILSGFLLGEEKEEISTFPFLFPLSQNLEEEIVEEISSFPKVEVEKVEMEWKFPVPFLTRRAFKNILNFIYKS
jgi:hypothetical protein